MLRINYDIIDTLLKNANNEYRNKILFNIKLLIEYANHISTMECKIQDLIHNDNGMSNYMIKELERQRRSKHDAAIEGLYNLNNIATDMGLSKVYEGNFDESDRGEIAQAIFELCKWYFEKNNF